nr:hypothetical protein [Propionibacteriales bacterium]
PPGNASTGGGTAVLAIDSARQAPAAPIDGGVAGGTVSVLSAYEPTSLDPSNSWSSTKNPLLSGLVTRSLTQYVYDPEQKSMVLVPDIATDIGTPNADFTQWSFTIREGVRYEDGTEVTADDVAYGIKRSFDRTAFPEGPPFSNQFLLNGDTYQGPYLSGTDYPGIVVDGNTLTLKMTDPFPDMPYYAAYPAIGPIPERGSNPATYGRHPLATGPYKIDEYAAGKSLTLVRNEEWDPATDPGRHAYPDRYEFTFDVTNERIDATILGDSTRAQATLSMDNVLADDYREARQLKRLTLGSLPCTFMWFPDYRKITDIRVRQAMAYAYPYHAAARISGNSLPGASILPPGFPGRQDYSVLDTSPGRTDPDRAREMLKEAGYAPGEYELTFLYVADDPGSVELKDLYVRSLEAAGFRTTPRSTPTREAYDSVRVDPDAPINLRMGGWCSDWPSGNSFLPPLFHSVSFKASEVFDNQAYFAEPAIDDEIERISQLPLDEQAAQWGALDKTIMTDYYPAIITGYNGVAMTHGSKIAGINQDSTYGAAPTWKDIYVMP